MRRFLLALCLLVSLFGTAKAQTRLTASVEAFDDRGLGYSLPVVRAGAGIEQPLGRHLEIDAFGSYASSHKAVLGNGHTLYASATPIVWLGDHVGITGRTRYTHLYTSAYSKGTFLPTAANTYKEVLGSFLIAPGVVFRGTPFGIPSRLYLDGVVPTGTINPATGIESNRLRGVEAVWEASLYDAGPVSVRFTVAPAFYHGYSQGNPQCDGTYGGPVTCQRAAWNAYTVGLGIKIVWPRDGGRAR